MSFNEQEASIEKEEAARSYAKTEQSPKSDSGSDVSPTPEQLQFFRDMTQEEWVANVAGGKQQIANAAAQEDEGRKQVEQSSHEKWERRIRALEAIRSSGDPAQDARGFLEAIGLDPNTLGPYAKAYQEGNSSMMLRYFKEVERQAHDLPAGFSKGIREYFRVFDETVAKIIIAAESAGVKE